MSRCPACGEKECCGGEMVREIDALQAEVKRLQETLSSFLTFVCNASGQIKWRRVDKDRIEFAAKALECDHLWGTRQGGFLVHCGKCGAIKQMEGE